MSSTTCFQKTSNNCTSSGTPLNLRTGKPSFSLPFTDSPPNVELASEVGDFSDSVIGTTVCGMAGGPQRSDSVVGDVGDVAR